MNKYYRSLVLADGQDGQSHVELKREIGWGQSPVVAGEHYIHWAREDMGLPGLPKGEIWGDLEPGDQVRFVMGVSLEGGCVRPGDPVRVLVHTHDGRRVGHSGNAVWIVWPGVKEARRIFRIVKGEK